MEGCGGRMRFSPMLLDLFALSLALVLWLTLGGLMLLVLVDKVAIDGI
jgi:hypothetical protein